MSAETIVCRRCGTRNEAGDQFCGSCGAFLEWEGEALETEVGAAPTTPPPPAAAAPPAPAAAAPAQAPSTPRAPAQPAAESPPADAVVCHACGRENPPGRTFCQSCGTRLRHAAGTPEAISTAAAAAPPGAPTPAPVGAAPARPRERPRPEPSGGLPGWLPVVIVLGVLAGIAVFAASMFLRTPDLPSAASLAPGTPPATLTPTLPPASPGDSGAAASVSVPPESVALTMTGASASSVVGNRPDFAPQMVIDGQLTTCWQEGAADETGEWIEVTFDPARLDYVVVYSGYQLSHDAWLANLRPKDVTVSVDGGPPQAFVLLDTEQPQRIDVDDVAGATTVRITLVSTYESQASAYPGSPFDDAAISEIRAFGAPGG